MSTILALDLGEKRIGVARASTIARLPEPLTTLPNDETLLETLAALIREHQVTTLVLGLPRGLQGQTTAQTRTVKEMGKTLGQALNMPIEWQDETLTSHQAEQELGASQVRYNKGAVDALAACLILEDYLRVHPQTTHEV